MASLTITYEVDGEFYTYKVFGRSKTHDREDYEKIKKYDEHSLVNTFLKIKIYVLETIPDVIDLSMYTYCEKIEVCASNIQFVRHMVYPPKIKYIQTSGNIIEGFSELPTIQKICDMQSISSKFLSEDIEERYWIVLDNSCFGGNELKQLDLMNKCLPIRSVSLSIQHHEFFIAIEDDSDYDDFWLLHYDKILSTNSLRSIFNQMPRINASTASQIKDYVETDDIRYSLLDIDDESLKNMNTYYDAYYDALFCSTNKNIKYKSMISGLETTNKNLDFSEFHSLSVVKISYQSYDETEYIDLSFCKSLKRIIISCPTNFKLKLPHNVQIISKFNKIKIEILDIANNYNKINLTTNDRGYFFSSTDKDLEKKSIFNSFVGFFSFAKVRSDEHITHI